MKWLPVRIMPEADDGKTQILVCYKREHLSECLGQALPSNLVFANLNKDKFLGWMPLPTPPDKEVE